MSESVHQKSRVDDDDDDLDDLDDVLDQFSPATQPSSSSPLPQPGPASSSTPPQHAAVDTSEVDLSQLAEGMESLLRELGVDPRAGSDGADGVAERERFAAAWEAMLVEGMDGMSESHAHTPAEGASSPKPKEDDFRSNIRSTMNRLKESESGLQSSDSTADGGDTFQTLLSQLEGLGDLTGDGDQSEDQLQGVLEAMMGQLMSKDVLHEPLKELYEKFPDYLDRNSSTISPEEKKRFEAQISCIKQLLDEFESGMYRDDDEKAREKIVELMTELQTHGSPPEEIMGPLPPGFSLGADGLPNMPDGCNMN